MTATRWIRTEAPDEEQWRLLGQFRYANNVGRYLAERWGSSYPPGTEEHVAGAMGQAEAYFAAARGAPLEISPLLGYYGASSLLAACGTLLSGAVLPTTSHGMSLEVPVPGRKVSDASLVVRTQTGAFLQLIAKVLGEDAQLPGGSEWSLGELLGSLPDLKDDVHLCVPSQPPYALRVEVFRRQGLTVERIPVSEFEGQSVDSILSQVSGLPQGYLAPQAVNEAVVLYRRLGGGAIGTESQSGQKCFLVAHPKGRRSCTPSQLLVQLMALFILGSLSRYHSALWHPFVRADATGERLLIERFVSLATRWLPNLVLDQILGERIRFVAPGQYGEGHLGGLTEEDIGDLVREVVDENGPDRR